MRKIFHIFLVLSLLMSTAGYAVTRHFCGEVLAHVSLGSETSSCCGSNESNEMAADCDGCENETDHLVVDDEFQLDQQEIKLNAPLQAAVISFFQFLAFAPVSEEHEHKLHPTLKYPPSTGPDIHISVQSFLL